MIRNQPEFDIYRIMKKYQTILALIVSLFVFQSASCGYENRKVYRIGVSQCSDDSWRDKMNEEIRREMLFHEDAEVEIRTANDNNARQISDIEYFIRNGFDAIIASPNQAEALTPVLKKAYEKGIPVIIFDRGVKGENYTSFIEFDNAGIGSEAADYAGHHIENGSVIELTGLPGSTPAEDRHRGFEERLREYPGLRLVAVASGDWKEAEAAATMDSLLKLYPDVKAVYAHNDLMAIGASHVLTKQGRRGEDESRVMVLGTDATPDVGIKSVLDSVIDATFIYPTDGHQLIKTTMAVLKGEPFEREVKSRALPPVDIRNAEIMLRQDKLLSDETGKLLTLQEKNEEIMSRQRAQTYLIFSLSGLAILLIVSILLFLRFFRQRSRYQRNLKEKNEELQRERDKQEELYKALDEATKSKLVFFTNVSHDLRTPLTLISGPVEKLSRAEYLVEEDRRLMRVAVKNVKILRRLIDQILDFRRYENGKSELHLSEVNLLRLIEEWSEAFQGIARSRDIRLTVEAENREEATMAVDTGMMERVFFNLLSNAIKYTPRNGKVEVRASESGERFELTVRDTGMGISKEDMVKIFDRFFQVDKVNPNGSGIGLALTQALIELHGGEIRVESEPGKGSEFRVTIPVRHVEESKESVVAHISEAEVAAEFAETEAAEQIFDSGKPLLLVIDDNRDILDYAVALLGADYNVITATGGKEGIRLASRFIPDLIICDVMMPGMDGIECVRILKREISTSHIPVMMLTASAAEETRVNSYDVGADAFLSKPFDGRLLKSRIRNLLDNRMRLKAIYSNAPGETGNHEKGTERSDIPKEGINDRMSLESDFYKSFVDIVNDDLGNSNIRLTDIASKLGIGATQLSRKIKALTNYSPVEVIRTLRLKRARKLLMSTEKTISEIAYEVGFTSPAYLSKCFRDAYGETPSDVRTKVRD